MLFVFVLIRDNDDDDDDDGALSSAQQFMGKTQKQRIGRRLLRASAGHHMSCGYGMMTFYSSSSFYKTKTSVRSFVYSFVMQRKKDRKKGES